MNIIDDKNFVFSLFNANLFYSFHILRKFVYIYIRKIYLYKEYPNITNCCYKICRKLLFIGVKLRRYIPLMISYFI